MRTSHFILYRFYMTYGLLSLGLGLNFLFLKPAFDVPGISKETMGLAFTFCSATKLVLINAPYRFRSYTLPLPQSIRWIRLSMALSVFLMTFWASALTVQFFRLHQTSLQLPITYIALAVIGFLLLLWPLVNPSPEKSYVTE